MFCVQDAGCQQVGFFLGSCGVQLALTSDTCFKALPRNANGELTSFKGTLSFFRVLSLAIFLILECPNNSVVLIRRFEFFY